MPLEKSGIRTRHQPRHNVNGRREAYEKPNPLEGWGSFAYNLPGGDFGWQNVGAKFRFAGSYWGAWNVNMQINCNITELCTTLAVDDFHVRYARGSIHVLQPAP